LRSMQLILQATHGVVSGAPAFFKRAFGDNYQDFESILLRPHHFIFNRDWYERWGGKPEFDEFTIAFEVLSAGEKATLVELLSSVEPREFHRLPQKASNSRLRSILRFYKPLPKDEEARIWSLQKDLEDVEVPEDERVEDAGLGDPGDDELVSKPARERRKVAVA
jgi:hypothetical protein